MRLEITSELYDQQSHTKGKFQFDEGKLDAIVNGVSTTLNAIIAHGKVYAAVLASEDLANAENELLSDWWYGVNFAGGEISDKEFIVEDAIEEIRNQ